MKGHENETANNYNDNWNPDNLYDRMCRLQALSSAQPPGSGCNNSEASAHAAGAPAFPTRPPSPGTYAKRRPSQILKSE
jgi:hypothetical protein